MTRDPASLVSSRPRLLATATEDWPLAPLFAFVKTHAWTDADAATHEAFGELAEHLGGQIEEISLDRTTERGIAAAMAVQSVELAFHFGPLLDRAPDLISKPLAGLIEEGRRTPGVDYVAALNAREAFYATVEEILHQHGTILTPAALGAAPKGLGATGNPVFCRFWTYLGRPGRDRCRCSRPTACRWACSSSAPAATTAACCARRDGSCGTSPRRIEARFASGRRGRRLSPAACR